jgi:adenylate kinase
MKIIIITGPPYSGKGTQCEIISKTMGYTHLSTGDRCRQEKASRTSIGVILSEFEAKGDLVPDAIMKDLFSKIIDENKQKEGIILDGYPRTQAQVDDLIELVHEKKEEISLVIDIEVPKEELLARAKKRATLSDREDDRNPDIHLKRVRIFESATRPAIEYMKYTLPIFTIDGTGRVDEITARITARINSL